MRVQLTLKPTTMEALAKRAEAADLSVSRVVEYVLSQWLLRNEPLVFGTMPSVVSRIAPVVSAPAVDPSSPFKHGAPVLPPDAFMTTSGKRRVDRVNFRMPICAECTFEVPEAEIGPDEMHIGCPGRT